MRRGTLMLAAAAILFVGWGIPVAGQTAPAVTLPKARPWHQELHRFLANCTEADVAIDLAAPGPRVDYARASAETAYRDWIGWAATDRPDATTLRAQARWFTLHGIEGGGTVRCFSTPEAAAWWSQFDAPGNPFVGQRGAKMRAVVMAAVDMLMLDRAHDADAAIRRSDFLGANMGTWAYAFLQARDVLPPEAVAGFRQGLLHHLAKLEKWGPTDINSNMDTKTLWAVVLLDACFDEPDVRRRAVAVARRCLFGEATRTIDDADGRQGIFHRAGYVGEMDGPETTYNGIALLNVLHATLACRGQPEWDALLPEVARRMSRFKAFNAFPDPDGHYDGPSSWAKRTADSTVFDQRSRSWRDVAAAMVSDDALYLLVSTRGRSNPYPGGFFDKRWLTAEITNRVQRSAAALRQPAGDEPPPWKENHWPQDLPYTWDYYVPGSHAKFTELASRQDERLLPPFSRPEDFNVQFDHDFWTVKQDGWGFQVESLASMGRGYEDAGLAGGGLTEFWTHDAGTVIRGKARGKNAKQKDDWSVVDNWAAHHVWGRMPNGKPFSSGRVRRTAVNYDRDADTGTVTVTAEFGAPKNPLADPENGLRAPIRYERRFELLANGLRVTTTVTFDPRSPPRELWESLPINLANASFQKDVPPTRMALAIGDRWRRLAEAGTMAPPRGASEPEPRVQRGDVVAGVRGLFLRRFAGGVVIEFDGDRRVRVHPEIWQTDYQTKDTIQVVAIDLLNGPESADAGRRSIAFTLRRRDP